MQPPRRVSAESPTGKRWLAEWLSANDPQTRADLGAIGAVFGVSKVVKYRHLDPKKQSGLLSDMRQKHAAVAKAAITDCKRILE